LAAQVSESLVNWRVQALCQMNPDLVLERLFIDAVSDHAAWGWWGKSFRTGGTPLHNDDNSKNR
jgi:hypothetical protein